MSIARILIVDDEAAQSAALSSTLRDAGYDTVGFTSARAALEALAAARFDLLITDLCVPEMDGLALLRAAHERDPDLAGIVMTAHGTIDSAVEAMQLGAVDYIQKPFSLSAVRAVLARALELRKLRLDNARLVRLERQRMAELESANRDLEAFSLAVSHDLRAPLRGITMSAQSLEEELAHSMPPHARKLLSGILANSQRMDHLVEDQLRFCRFSRQPLSKAPVDLRALALTVLARLELESVETRIGELPVCQADASLLDQVFMNLFANAAKFSSRVPCPTIEAGCRSECGEDVIFVRDNGAGFDMRYADKLFGVFQRLHSNDEFEGTGVGLSIVQRIIERHGGRIWAESAPGAGATFYFTL